MGALIGLGALLVSVIALCAGDADDRRQVADDRPDNSTQQKPVGGGGCDQHAMHERWSDGQYRSF